MTNPTEEGVSAYNPHPMRQTAKGMIFLLALFVAAIGGWCLREKSTADHLSRAVHRCCGAIQKQQAEGASAEESAQKLCEKERAAPDHGSVKRIRDALSKVPADCQ